jgi:twitching motility protein PilT
MTSEYNEYVLSTAYHSGWITAEQYTAAVTALQSMPNVSAIDFLHEQTLISPGQAEGLRQALTPAAAVVENAAMRMDGAHEISRSTSPSTPAPEKNGKSHAEVTEPSLGQSHAHNLPAGLRVDDLLRLAVAAGASDLHLGVSSPALIRRHGTLQPLIYEGAAVLTATNTEALVHSFLNEMQLASLEKNKGLDFSYDIPGLARFRANVVRQRKGHDAVFRIIDSRIRSMDELGLPESLKVLTQYHNGLVLITGAVGSGKSTTLAAMVDEVNRHRKDHIITLEDPIEYVFTPVGCQITQREVHAHTESFSAALRASLREDPDVIMVGEMRDLETIQLAITASETGHLVLATLHTSNAARTLDRILDAFPVEQQGQIRTMVSESLRGIISQQLVPKLDGTGRVVALEIMVNTPAVANLIRESKTFMLPGIIQTGKKLGMKLMDDSLIDLVEGGIISPHEAYDRAEQKKLLEPYLT